jgi:hypothetical protein
MVSALVCWPGRWSAGLIPHWPYPLVLVLDPAVLIDELWEDRDDMGVVHRRMADLLWRARERDVGLVNGLLRLLALASCRSGSRSRSAPERWLPRRMRFVADKPSPKPPPIKPISDDAMVPEKRSGTTGDKK